MRTMLSAATGPLRTVALVGVCVLYPQTGRSLVPSLWPDPVSVQAEHMVVAAGSPGPVLDQSITMIAS